jgi:dihydrofolate reductase
MKIRARMSMSADGYVTTPAGWPALMGRTTFEPALRNDRWPWPDLQVFVLGSRRPAGTPDHVVTDSDPVRLLDRLRAANRGGDVHLVGGPRTIQTCHALGALDTLELVVVPLLFGDGMRLTSALSPTAALTFERQRALPGGSVEIVYSCRGRRPPLPGAPASQR